MVKFRLNLVSLHPTMKTFSPEVNPMPKCSMIIICISKVTADKMLRYNVSLNIVGRSFKRSETDKNILHHFSSILKQQNWTNSHLIICKESSTSTQFLFCSVLRLSWSSCASGWWKRELEHSPKHACLLVVIIRVLFFETFQVYSLFLSLITVPNIRYCSPWKPWWSMWRFWRGSPLQELDLGAKD